MALTLERRDDSDGCDDSLDSGAGIKSIVTIVTTVTSKFRRGAGCPFQRAALLGEATAVAGGKAP